MKKIVLLLMTAVALLSCEDKVKDVEKPKWDPTAQILIRPAPKSRAFVPGLTDLEIVTNALNIKWQSHYGGNKYYEVPKEIGRSFPEDAAKDYSIPALKMLAIDVITDEGEYYKDLTYGFNVYITDHNGDTIAYVPDGVISAARVEIENAFNEEDYERVYSLFNTAFTFLPVE